MKTWQKIKQNPELVAKYLVRERVVDTIREYFKGQGFHEVQTPILVPVPSAESNLEVFTSELRTAKGEKRTGYLIMSPEYSLKKLITAEVGSCFEITRSFRNEEEVSPSHNPEFTMLEWYRVGVDYKSLMTDFEKLFIKIVGGDKLNYQGQEYDLTLPWPRITVAEAFEKYCGIDKETLVDENRMIKKAREKGYMMTRETTWEQAFYQIFFNEIEPKLKESRRPAFIYDYPLAQGALARKKKEDPRFAERVEIFLAGLELGNGFSELTDAQEQERRFEADLSERKRLGKTEYPMDMDFIEALKTGMPEVTGIAVGVDRLIMLAADVPTIAETLFFPGNELFDL